MNLKEYIFNRENPVIFDKKKFVYFPSNKVMQTTLVKNLLSDRCIVLNTKNEKLWLKTFNKTNFDEIYKFGITRHPVTKFESAFNYLKSRNKHSKKMGITNIKINDYVKNVIMNYNNPFKLNPHFEKQYESFYFNNELIVDELFKIESKEEISKMYKKLGINYDTNICFNKTTHLEKLDNESIKIIEEIYSNDLSFYK